MLAYFLKVNVAIVLFYAFYRLFFYKDTFFGWRRMVLLSFFAISAAVPLLNIQTWITEQEPMVVMADLYASVVLPEFTITKSTTDWKSIILEYASIAYWGIVILLAWRFIIQLISIIRLACRCRKEQIGGTNIFLLPKAGGPFSFFHWIFICPSSHTEEEVNEILTHEQTHARQWHSVDVIVSELACILCWFNPFAWLMKREIRTNLEYMADARVLENGYDSKTYQYHLLGLSHHKAAATIYNSFNVLPLKKRINMMNKKRTKEIGRTKYLMFIPLAALLMIISNIETVARTTEKMATNVIETVDLKIGQIAPIVQDTVPTGTIFEVVEKMPAFPGGMDALFKYLSNNIKYPEGAKAKGIQGRVTLQFVVNQDGSISDVKTLRGVEPSLDAEAIRVARSMPAWKPGMQRGQNVRVKYTMPVVFNLQGKKDAKSNPKEVQPDANGVYEVVDKMPEFPGGMQKLMEYISKNIKYPAEAQTAGKQGRVIVQMIIDDNGKITNPRVLQGVDPLLDTEAIRLINSMPNWKPGMEKGKAVKVKYTIPVVFRLQ